MIVTLFRSDMYDAFDLQMRKLKTMYQENIEEEVKKEIVNTDRKRTNRRSRCPILNGCRARVCAPK